MLSQDTKSKVQKLWNVFWSRGITNPITAIEQISYLLFVRRLENVDEYDDVTTNSKKKIFEGHEDCLWSNFSTMKPDDMLNCYRNRVFPFIKSLNNDNDSFSRYMRDAVNGINKASLLHDAVIIINEIYEDIDKEKEKGQQFQDIQGDIYEYLLNEIAISGKNGQFRTPRHIIQFICDLLDPDVEDTVCDPACGTSGFLLGAFQRILTKHTPKGSLMEDENGLLRYKNSSDAVLSDEEKRKLSTSTFYGFDIDRTMVRIGLMNLMLHGIYHPKIENTDSLSAEFSSKYSGKKYSVVMANPPFTGIISLDDLSNDLKGYGKKTELLFLIRIMQILQTGGKAALIIPEGVLFGHSKQSLEVRKKLLRDCKVIAILSLPQGVFKPYAGVKTSILFFKKEEDNSTEWHTDNIWYYELPNDGYSLDDNRRKLDENPLPDAEEAFRNRQQLQGKTKQFFHLSIDEIQKNNFDLHFDRYRLYEDENINLQPPRELLDAIISLEEGIMKDLQNLKELI